MLDGLPLLPGYAMTIDLSGPIQFALFFVAPIIAIYIATMMTGLLFATCVSAPGTRARIGGVLAASTRGFLMGSGIYVVGLTLLAFGPDPLFYRFLGFGIIGLPLPGMVAGGCVEARKLWLQKRLPA